MGSSVWLSLHVFYVTYIFEAVNKRSGGVDTNKDFNKIVNLKKKKMGRVTQSNIDLANVYC